MKIGILGGTFNPPHKGHLKLGRDFARELKLDKILIIPSKSPTHKEAKSLASGRDRLKMCSLLFTDSVFEVSDIEIASEKESYTIYTLKELKKLYPDDELYLIIGSDMFLFFDKWYRYKDILSLCTVCVESREDSESTALLKRFSLETLGIDADKSDKIIISSVAPLPVSSTDIRQRIKEKRGVKRLLGEEELEYIIGRRLYLD